MIVNFNFGGIFWVGDGRWTFFMGEWGRVEVYFWWVEVVGPFLQMGGCGWRYVLGQCGWVGVVTCFSITHIYNPYIFNTNRIKFYICLTWCRFLTILDHVFSHFVKKLSKLLNHSFLTKKYFERFVGQISFFSIFIITGTNVEALPIVSYGFL